MFVPIAEFDWSAHTLSEMHELTCANHPEQLRYLTKNPYLRGLHIVAPLHAAGSPEGLVLECACPFIDLVVIVDDEAQEGI